MNAELHHQRKRFQHSPALPVPARPSAVFVSLSVGAAQIRCFLSKNRHSRKGHVIFYNYTYFFHLCLAKTTILIDFFIAFLYDSLNKQNKDSADAQFFQTIKTMKKREFL